MGMFDSVYVRCSNPECETLVEFQSKSGPCECTNYTLRDCPDRVALDLLNRTELCPSCATPVTIRGRVQLMAI